VPASVPLDAVVDRGHAPAIDIVDLALVVDENIEVAESEGECVSNVHFQLGENNPPSLERKQSQDEEW